MDNQQERLFNLGWIVGAIESEGSFSIVRSARNKNGIRYTPLVNITNSDDDFIMACINILKENNIPFYVYKRRQTNGIVKSRKGIRNIIIRGLMRSKKIIDLILPLLKSKKKQAMIISDFVNYRLSINYRTPFGAIDEQFRNKICSLNRIPRDYTSNMDLNHEDIVRSAMKIAEQQ